MPVEYIIDEIIVAIEMTSIYLSILCRFNILALIKNIKDVKKAKK